MKHMLKVPATHGDLNYGKLRLISHLVCFHSGWRFERNHMTVEGDLIEAMKSDECSLVHI